jgi:SAM-dependent methyltransferase
MTAADRQRWDDRYRAGGWPPAAGPPALLEAASPWLDEPGAALDIASGPGAAALWLAERGWSVDAVDISPVALEALGHGLRERGVEQQVRVVEADLDDGWPVALAGPYDLVLCLHFRYRALRDVAVEHLRPGGLVVASVLSTVGRDGAEPGGPDPRFLADPGELVDRLAGFEVLLHEEAGGQAGIVARRPPSTA